jgi:hemerythrin
MRQFQWTKAHSTYLPEVDAEHRYLFRMADELHHAVRAGQDKEHLRTLMQTLIGAVEEHFAHEERLMESARCESYAWHRQQHDTLRSKGRHYLELFDAGDAHAPVAFINFTARWFRDHMGLTDRMMGAQVRNADRLNTAAR